MKVEKYPINKYYANDNDVKCTVLHVDLGREAGTKSHLKNVASASYHDYIPKRKDVVIQFVDIEHGAWHAGKKSNPTEIGDEVLGGLSANRNSYALCLEARPVDVNGNVSYDWSKVVDGEMPSTDQLDRAVQRIKDMGFGHLPVIAHVEITSYKPKVVRKCTDYINKKLRVDVEPVCEHGTLLADATWNEVINRLIELIKAKQK